MEIKMQGKKGMFLTFISITIIAAAIIIFTPTNLELNKDIPVISTRVSNVNNYVLDLENVYLERALYSSSTKALLALYFYTLVPVGSGGGGGPFPTMLEFNESYAEVVLTGKISGTPRELIMSEVNITQGDSVDLSYGLTPSQDLTSWVCQVMVKKTKSDAALIDVTLPNLSGDTFSRIGSLTPAQTALLAPGVYLLLAELSRSATSKSKEFEDTLKVAEQGVFT